jgi:hypothetical protein
VQRPGQRAAVGRDQADRHVRVGQVRARRQVDDVRQRDQAAAQAGRRAVDGGDHRDTAAGHTEHEFAAVRDGRGALYRIAAEFR